MRRKAYNLSEERALKKQASAHALSYALAQKGLYLAAPRVAAIFGLKVAAWEDFNRLDKYQQEAIRMTIDEVFKKQFGSVIDPMHVDFSTFRRPSFQEVVGYLTGANNAMGLSLPPQDINELASYVFNDWNTIVSDKVHSILNIVDPRGTA